jgi:sugar phosphate isomerase/epimerase
MSNDDLHQRLSVSSVCLGPNTSLEDDLAFFSSRGISRVGFRKEKLEARGWTSGIENVQRSGISVEYLIHAQMFTLDSPKAWIQESTSLIRTLDAAAQIGVSRVYGTTGPAGQLTWEQAATALVSAIRPAAEHAERTGIKLMLENTNALNQASNFVYNLADLVDLARDAHLGICVDVFHCWRERGLEQSFRRAGANLLLVQLSDYVPGTTEMRDRAVPGDGIIPLERLIKWLLDAGYAGIFDLETLGPRIEAEGVETATLRGAKYVSTMLDRLSA